MTYSIIFPGYVDKFDFLQLIKKTNWAGNDCVYDQDTHSC